MTAAVSTPSQIDKQFNMSRPLDESPRQFLERLNANVDKVVQKKNRKKNKAKKEDEPAKDTPDDEEREGPGTKYIHCSTRTTIQWTTFIFSQVLTVLLLLCSCFQPRRVRPRRDVRAGRHQGGQRPIGRE